MRNAIVLSPRSVCDDLVRSGVVAWATNTIRNPTDRCKIGVKRSLLTETHGVLIDLAIDGATRHDTKLVRASMEILVVMWLKPTYERQCAICLDTSYGCEEVWHTFAKLAF